MTWTNYQDVHDQITAAGLVIDPQVGLRVDTTKPVRCKVEGGSNERRGWYKLFSLGELITGAYGIWSANDPQSFKVDLPKAERKKLTADELAAIKAKQAADAKRAEAERSREIEAAAIKASRWWRQLQDAGESGYMAKKGFAANELFGARISKAGNLVVPVQDATGKTYGLQVISATKNRHGRDKDFTPPGLAKKAHFFQLGLVQRGGVVLLCEGFATGASLRKATGLPVVVAFDAGNLTPVALAIHKAHRRDVRILICADDDYLTDAKTGKNPGRDAAATAAVAVDGQVVWPIFPGERPTDSKGPTDFNDLHCHPDGGLQAVRAQVEAALATAGWRAQSTPTRAGGSPTGGGGKAPKIGPDGMPEAVSIMSLDDLVERFIPIDDGRGKCVWDNWKRRVVEATQMAAMTAAGVRGDDIKRHPVWQERGAVHAEQIGFDPAGEEVSIRLNTWRGWPMAPKDGKCDKILDLIWHLCSREEGRSDIMDWLLNWIAYPLQYPGAKMQSAVMVHGEQGTGKSTIFRILAEIYGYKDIWRNYAVVLDQKALQAKYNSDWDSKLYILAEEVVNSADKWQLKNELKELVTGDRIRIEKKFLDAYSQANRCNIVFLSNEDQPLPLENKDRRHLVIYTPPALELDQYADIRDEIENGGIAAFYQFLMSIDLSSFKPWSRPPMTEAKQAIIDASLSSEDEFFRDWFAGETPFPVCACRGDDLYAAYVLYCRRINERSIAPRRRFRLKLAHMNHWQHRKQVHVHDSYHFTPGTRQVRLEIPGDALINAYALAMGAKCDQNYTQRAGETVAQWATRSMLDFAKAVDDAQPQLKVA
jgi:putative DNA primase/helicase